MEAKGFQLDGPIGDDWGHAHVGIKTIDAADATGPVLAIEDLDEDEMGDF